MYSRIQNDNDHSNDFVRNNLSVMIGVIHQGTRRSEYKIQYLERMYIYIYKVSEE
jgi:hypothetical protein